MNNRGFTLLEMMIAVSIMSVIVMGGTLILFRTLGSSGINQSQLNVTSSGNQVLQAIENNIRFQRVKSVSDDSNIYDRTKCMEKGKTGDFVSGAKLEVYDQFDSTLYSRSDDKISSNSSVISSDNLVIKEIVFKWYCIPGTNDRVSVTIKVNEAGLSETVPDRTQTRDINMYNSF